MKDHLRNSGSFSLPRVAALLLGVSTMGAASHLHAATIEILQKELPQNTRVYRAHYDVDQTTNDVRVLVEFSRPDEGPGDSAGVTFTSEAFPMPELSFDRKSGEIRLNSGTASTTCARETRLLWAKWYKPTSACRLVVENQQQSRDGLATTIALVELTTGDSARLSGPK